MKKITFFIQQVYGAGGTERVLSLIANELSKEYDVEIISMFKTKPVPFYELNEKITLNYIFEKEYNSYLLYFPYILYKAKKFFKSYHTDIFICTGMGMVIPTIHMAKKTTYIAWEHFNSNIGGFGSLKWWCRKIAALKADKIVVLTEKDLNLYKLNFNPRAELVHIYNPTEKNSFKYDYDMSSKKILSVGRLSYQKGFDMLVDVASKIFDKHKDWEWHIYGDGEDREKINQLIIDKNLQNNVKLMGRTDKMKELYNEYAMYVMTSRYEGFAMVNIEAHYAKLPIVSFNCDCGPDEIIQDGINGYLVECFDIDKMADRINYLIENKEVRKKMSDNTMLDKEKLQMENVIKEWKKIL